METGPPEGCNDAITVKRLRVGGEKERWSHPFISRKIEIGKGPEKRQRTAAQEGGKKKGGRVVFDVTSIPFAEGVEQCRRGKRSL